MKIDTTTLLVRASGKKQNLFVEKDWRECKSSTELEIQDSNGVTLKTWKIQDAWRAELDILDIDLCEEYTLNLRIIGKSFEIKSFGPYYKELDDKQTLDIRDNFNHKKPSNIKFNTNGTNLVVSWNSTKICGKTLAIFIEDKKIPKKILSGPDLLAGQTEIEIGPCKGVNKEDLVAEIFLSSAPDLPLNENIMFEEVFGDVDLITGPNKASFDPIQANEYTVYKKDVSKNSSCLRKTDYLLTITNSKGEVVATDGFFPVDLAETSQTLEPCQTFNIQVLAKYILVNDQEGDLVIYDDTVTSDIRGGLYVGKSPYIDMEDNHIKMVGLQCNFSYYLVFQPSAGYDDIKVDHNQIKNGNLPLDQVSDLKACTAYDIKLVDEKRIAPNTTYSLQNTRLLKTPKIDVRVRETNGMYDFIHSLDEGDHYSNCEEIVFKVECINLEENNGTLDIDPRDSSQSESTICTSACVMNVNTTEPEDYQCRIKVVLEDLSEESPWSSWQAVKKSRVPRQGHSYDGSEEDGDVQGENVSPVSLVIGALCLLLIIGAASIFLVKRKQRRRKASAILIEQSRKQRAESAYTVIDKDGSFNKYPGVDDVATCEGDNPTELPKVMVTEPSVDLLDEGEHQTTELDEEYLNPNEDEAMDTTSDPSSDIESKEKK